MLSIEVRRKNLIIGIGEYVVSNKKEDTIKTYALASCVAVIIYSSSKKVSGMVHISLPEAELILLEMMIYLLGQKNIEAIKKNLTNIGLKHNLQEVGSFVSRSIEMEVTTGNIKLDTQPIRI